MPETLESTELDESARYKRTVRAAEELFKKIGFRFVAIDVDGYRTGALNEIFTQITPSSQ